MSYAHLSKVLKGYTSIWEEMYLYYAHAGGDKLTDGSSIRTLLPGNSLVSYAASSPSQLNQWQELWRLKLPRVIIDSGAFTAYTSGKVINPRDYATWALSFQKEWRHKMASLVFMNLDVIGDQEASWKNQSLLEALGMQPIPVVTYGADKSHLIRALDNYPYLALGGLVPYSTQKTRLQAWLDYCFAEVYTRFKTKGIMPKIHLLGVTKEWCLLRYPCYGSDSSSWIDCLRFGRATHAGLKKIPSYTHSKAAHSTTIHTLKAAIAHYKRMQDNATKLWEGRGIIFD